MLDACSNRSCSGTYHGQSVHLACDVRQSGNSPGDTIVTGSIILPPVLPQMPTAFVALYGGLTVAAVASAAAAMQHKVPPPPPAAQQWLQQLQLEALAAALAAVAYAASRPLLWRLACDVRQAGWGCGRGARARTAASSRGPEGDGEGSRSRSVSCDGDSGSVGLSAAAQEGFAGRVRRGLSASSVGLVPLERCTGDTVGDTGLDEMLAGEGCRKEDHTGEGEAACEEQGRCIAVRPLEIASAGSTYAPAECGCGVCECGYECMPGCAGCKTGVRAFPLQEAMEVVSRGAAQAGGRASCGPRGSCDGGGRASAGGVMAPAAGGACADPREDKPSATRPRLSSSSGGSSSALAAVGPVASTPHPSLSQLQLHPDPDALNPLADPQPQPPPPQQQHHLQEQQEPQAAPLSPLAQARRLIRDAAQQEYLGATALQRVVLRLPDLQPGDLPGGWVRELLGRLADRWGCGWGGSRGAGGGAM